MTRRKGYYSTHCRNGTEDEITLHTPKGRPMLCVGCWDAEWDDDPIKHDADQLKADAALIVDAVNAYRDASVTALLKSIKPIKTRLTLITAAVVAEEDLSQPLLDAAYDYHEHIQAVQIVLSQFASKGARISNTAIDALRELVEGARAYLAQPEVAELVPSMDDDQ